MLDILATSVSTPFNYDPYALKSSRSKAMSNKKKNDFSLINVNGEIFIKFTILINSHGYCI